MEVTDRNKLIAFSCAVAVSIPTGFFWVSPFQAEFVIRHSGYWLLLFTLVSFIFCLWQTQSPGFWRPNSNWLLPLIFILSGGFLLVLHEPYLFKVMDDEAVLLGTSYYIHLERQIFCPTQAHDLQGSFFLLNGFLDKRPYFFPVLLSILHDFTDYRSGNAFILNTALAFVLLWLAWIWGKQVAGTRGGVVLVLLLAGLPLLASAATGAGFDLLNLVMLLSCMLLGLHFLRTRSRPAMSAFTLGVVLFAQTRYESALFVIACGVVVLAVWIRERRVFLTWPVVLAPLLMLPSAWLYRIFQSSERFWQLPEGLENPFSLAYFSDNLGHAFNFFFDFSFVQQNSILLTVAGGIGLVGSLVAIVRNRSFLRRDIDVIFLAFGGIVLLNFLVLLCYHWGRVDDYVASRLALPLCLLMALGAIHAISNEQVSPRVWHGFIGVAALFIVAYSIPSTANHFAVQRYVSAHEAEVMREFIRSNREHRFLYVSHWSTVPIVERAPALSIRRANARLDAVRLHVDHRVYDSVIVFQRIHYDPLTGQSWVEPDHDMGESVSLEPIFHRRMTERSFFRASRIVQVEVEIKGADEVRVEDLWGRYLP